MRLHRIVTALLLLACALQYRRVATVEAELAESSARWITVETRVVAALAEVNVSLALLKESIDQRENKPMKMKMQPKKAAFLAAFTEVPNVSLAARSVPCNRSSHYRWLNDPAYVVQFDRARVDAVIDFTNRAVRRARAEMDRPAAILSPPKKRQGVALCRVPDFEPPDLDLTGLDEVLSLLPSFLEEDEFDPDLTA